MDDPCRPRSVVCEEEDGGEGMNHKFEYKCRRCGVVDGQVVECDCMRAMTNMARLSRGDVVEGSAEGQLYLYGVCRCADGGCGVSDLIGASRVKG